MLENVFGNSLLGAMLTSLLGSFAFFAVYLAAITWLACRIVTTRPVEYKGTPFLLRNSEALVSLVAAAVVVVSSPFILSKITVKVSENQTNKRSAAFEPLVHITIHR